MQREEIELHRSAFTHVDWRFPGWTTTAGENRVLKSNPSTLSYDWGKSRGLCHDVTKIWKTLQLVEARFIRIDLEDLLAKLFVDLWVASKIENTFVISTAVVSWAARNVFSN